MRASRSNRPETCMCVWHCPSIPVAGGPWCLSRRKLTFLEKTQGFHEVNSPLPIKWAVRKQKLGWVILYRYVPIPNLKPLS